MDRRTVGRDISGSDLVVGYPLPTAANNRRIFDKGRRIAHFLRQKMLN
jgi:hypothetical protein